MSGLSFVFKFTLANLLKFRSLFVIVVKGKSQILSFKICEELSAEQKLENQQIQSNRQVIKSNQKRTVHQRFLSNRVRLFSFLLWLLTDWRYVFVADFEALSYQVTRKFIRCRNAETRTISAIKYTACYRLVFCLPVL